jgi:hypothetical protein
MAAYLNSALVSFAASLVLVKVTAFLFGNERIIFAR